MKFHVTKWDKVDKSVLGKTINSVGQLSGIKKGTSVFIKPNFTFPFHKPGVTTPPDLIRALVEILVERGAKVTIGEGGPSLDVFDLQDSFEDHGLYALEKEYGIRTTHLRNEDAVYLTFGGKKRLEEFQFLSFYSKKQIFLSTFLFRKCMQ